jgi:hypothetical protein
MQAPVHTRKSIRLKLWGSAKAKKRTCPRCQSGYEGIGCLECGWVPDTSVACYDAEKLNEGKIAAA